MKKTVVIHPLLFAISPILFLFAHNIEEAIFSDTFIPIAIMLGLVLLLLLLSWLILKDIKKAGIIISISLVLVFSYGDVFFGLLVPHLQDIFGNNLLHLFLLFTWSMLFIISAYFIIRTRRNLRNLTNFFNIVGVCLIAISLFNIGVYQLKTRAIWQDIKNTGNIETDPIEDVEINTPASIEPATLPDIYYIIFDRYASASTLKEFYGFDNSEFINYLTDRGFYHASESKCNYPNTWLSLTSSLNMEYHYHTTEKVKRGIPGKIIIRKMSQNHKVWRFLKSRGYTFIQFGSDYNIFRKNEYADMNVNLFGLPPFLGLLYSRSMLYPVGAAFGIGCKRRVFWKRVLYKFDKLAEVPNIKEPTFVFVHFTAPHDPYVFDREGKFLSRIEDCKRSVVVKYVDEIIFINSKIKALIDELLSKSEVPPIIILQADEGPYIIKSDACERLSEKWLRKRMRILNAYYLPNGGDKYLYESITPVNTFRIIFNHYFGANYEILKDKSYVSTLKCFYEFIDVTDSLNSALDANHPK